MPPSDPSAARDSTAGPSASEGHRPHACHCGKRFARKEHLTRHQLNHQPKQKFVCDVCSQHFSRSDVLHRHQARHVAAANRPRHRACDACRTSKRKCDGNGVPCTSCRMQNVACVYPEGAKQPASEPERPDGTEHVQDLDPVSDTEDGESNERDWLSLSSLVSNYEPSSPGTLGPWLETASGETRRWVAACSVTYFQSFHLHWPLFHAPTFDMEQEPLPLSLTVFLIGRWLRGRPKPTQPLLLGLGRILSSGMISALDKHGNPWSCKGAWPIEMCQTLLLAIILELHLPDSGSHKATAEFLLGRLIQLCRAVDIFSSETHAYQERTFQPGDFQPYVVNNRNQWRNFVACLFRIDCYLSISLNRPPNLLIRELDVGLPNTFSLQNAHPLPVFFRRQSEEAWEHFEHKMYELCSDPPPPFAPSLFVEDTLLGLAGLWPHIAAHQREASRATAPGGPSRIGVLAHAPLLQKLDAWKSQLDAFAAVRLARRRDTPATALLFRAYRGLEPEGEGEGGDGGGEAEDAAWRRLAALGREAALLHAALAMHLHAPLRRLRRLLEPTDGAAGVADRVALEAALRPWARSPLARAALDSAVAALQECEAGAREQRAGLAEGPGPELAARVVLGAAARVALRASADVVIGWSWVIASQPEGEDDGVNRCKCDMVVDGLSLCKCELEGWVARFIDLLGEAIVTPDGMVWPAPQDPI